MSRSAFSPPVLLAFAAAVAAAFALSLFLLAGDDGAPREAVGPSAYSRSAIGYAGLFEFLRRLDVPVLKGRKADAIGPDDLLVMAEPPPTAAREETRAMLGKAETALVILPLWRGFSDPDHRGWIRGAALKEPDVANEVLALTGAKGRAVRVATPGTWTVNTIGVAPDPGPRAQLLADSDLEPLVAAPEGVLLGERWMEGVRVLVLSDPSILSNAGITRDANARFAAALIGDAWDRDGRIVFDEVIHGHRATDLNALRLPFEPRFRAVTLLGLAALGLTLWAAAIRFGPPLAAPERLPAGKGALIRNAARLIALAGRGGPVVAAYVAATMREAGRRLRAPPRLDEAELAAWLDRAGRARGVRASLPDLLRRAEASRQEVGLAGADALTLVRLAGDAWRWKREILRGA